MATMHERLHELAGATHAQLDPSDDLLAQIRLATVGRRARRLPSRPQLLVACASVVIAAIALSASLGQHIAGDRRLSAQPTTGDRAVIARGDRACDIIGAAISSTTIVFPTANGYATAATALIAATQQALAEIDAGITPSAGRPVLDTVDTDLQAALVALHNVERSAGGGDLNAAQTALDNFTTLTGHARHALAGYGAHQCAQ